MSRIGAIVRRLYAEELRPAFNKGAETTEIKRKVKRGKLKSFKNALSKRRTIRWIVSIATVLAVILVVAESIFQFNRLVSWQTVVMARRADVDRELRRRENLIPNLVYAVSKYAIYEQGVFKHVSDAREALKLVRSPQAPRNQISSLLEKTLSGLVALAEEYPDLKATQSIQDLIKEVASTEDRIAEAKKEYNKACEVYNQYRTIVPGNVYALLYRFKALPFIGLEEDAKVPVIDLNMTEHGGDMKEQATAPYEISEQTSNNTIKK